jgi:hypothetical protein
VVTVSMRAPLHDELGRLRGDPGIELRETMIRLRDQPEGAAA